MIETTEITVKDCKIPKAFSGYRILQISDLHEAQFGSEQEELLDRVKTIGADCVALTGDFVGGKDTDLKKILRFFRDLSSISFCCYVTGNHETRLDAPDLERLLGGMTAYGIEVLRGKMVSVSRGEDSIQILGIDDPGFINDEKYERDAQTVRDAIQSIPYDSVCLHCCSLTGRKLWASMLNWESILYCAAIHTADRYVFQELVLSMFRCRAGFRNMTAVCIRKEIPECI